MSNAGIETTAERMAQLPPDVPRDAVIVVKNLQRDYVMGTETATERAAETANVARAAASAPTAGRKAARTVVPRAAEKPSPKAESTAGMKEEMTAEARAAAKAVVAATSAVSVRPAKIRSARRIPTHHAPTIAVRAAALATMALEMRPVANRAAMVVAVRALTASHAVIESHAARRPSPRTAPKKQRCRAKPLSTRCPVPMERKAAKFRANARELAVAIAEVAEAVAIVTMRS